MDGEGVGVQYEYACSDRLGRSDWNLRRPCPQFNYPGSYRFPYLQGTNAAFRRELLLRVGGFDEAFAYYLDETELCLRVNDAGYVIRQLSGAKVRHKMAASGLREGRVILDHSPILKSKLYFSLRHGKKVHSGREIEKEWKRFVGEHQAVISMWIRKGWAEASQWEEFERRVQVSETWARQRAGLPPVLLGWEEGKVLPQMEWVSFHSLP
ncbi:MAG: hypothetical protein HC904_16965, partial [Blastochloris sp.]|nr:hypothetical protein [Blastochloris sp.]